MKTKNSRHLELLQHTLGNKTMYRNYFAASEGHDDIQALIEMVNLGLMIRRQAPEWSGEFDIFHATEAGKKLALDAWIGANQ